MDDSALNGARAESSSDAEIEAPHTNGDAAPEETAEETPEAGDATEENEAGLAVELEEPDAAEEEDAPASGESDEPASGESEELAAGGPGGDDEESGEAPTADAGDEDDSEEDDAGDEDDSEEAPMAYDSTSNGHGVLASQVTEPEETSGEDVAAPAAAAEGAAPEGEAAAEGEEAEEEEELPEWIPGDWFVVHTYAGYENKVKTNLESRVHSMNMEEKIFEVVIPMEDVMEVKSGKKQVVQRKVFPGYLLVRMDLDDDSWYVVRNTPGVTGFVGSGTKPIPLSDREVDRILQRKGVEEKVKPKLEYSPGDGVRVVTGPFANFQGVISEIDSDRSKLKVLVNIFGRETPVELGFDQVAKI